MQLPAEIAAYEPSPSQITQSIDGPVYTVGPYKYLSPAVWPILYHKESSTLQIILNQIDLESMGPLLNFLFNRFQYLVVSKEPANDEYCFDVLYYFRRLYGSKSDFCTRTSYSFFESTYICLLDQPDLEKRSDDSYETLQSLGLTGRVSSIYHYLQHSEKYLDRDVPILCEPSLEYDPAGCRVKNLCLHGIYNGILQELESHPFGHFITLNYSPSVTGMRWYYPKENGPFCLESIFKDPAYDGQLKFLREDISTSVNINFSPAAQKILNENHF